MYLHHTREPLYSKTAVVSRWLLSTSAEVIHCFAYRDVICVSCLHLLMGAQWLSGRVLDSRPKGRGFEPHRRHCVVSLSKNINPSLVLVQPRKTRPYISERLLMGRKESNQTKHLLIFTMMVSSGIIVFSASMLAKHLKQAEYQPIAG